MLGGSGGGGGGGAKAMLFVGTDIIKVMVLKFMVVVAMD